MKIKKVRQITTETITGYKCDVCKKIYEGASFPDDWHSFSSHHEEWGNDSIDSYENYHVCSVECYIKKFIEAVDEDLAEREEAEVDNFRIQFARKLADYFRNKSAG